VSAFGVLLSAPADSETCTEIGSHLGNGCQFPAPTAAIFDWAPLATYHLFGVPIEVTKPAILLAIGTVLILAFFFVAFRKPALVPSRTQSLGELGYTFVRDQISREVIGKDGDKYVPFLVSLFFFVWVMNLFSIIPGAQFPVTSRFAFPVGLALVIWVLYMFLGMKKQGPIKFFTNFMFPPGLPKPIYVILAPIELLSNVIVRPFTLAVRLFANMFAGHLLITIFSVGAWYLAGPQVLGWIGATGSFAMTVALSGFEMFIQFLQAFIFTLLTAVYIGGSLHAEH
jgi:F-type H+-transporting ATPase subunit a